MTATRSIFSLLQEYEKRSIAHSAAAPEVSEEAGHWRAVAYRMGTHMLASSFDQVIEITSIPPMTVVPRCEPWLLGVAIHAAPCCRSWTSNCLFSASAP
jgi:twitching motility protein PilI